jgi:cell division protein FtsN
MKLAFLLLALANLMLFAWQQGDFGGLPEAGREPDRMNHQIEPARIRALTQPEVQELLLKAKEVPRDPSQGQSPSSSTAPVAPIAAADLVGSPCVEVGDFTIENASRVRQRLEALAIGERLTVKSVEAPGWFMVYLPPFKTKAEVDRRADELRKMGLKELLVISDNTPMRYGIALGSFKDQDLAMRHAADLEKRGIKGVRVADKPSSLSVTRFQVRVVDTPVAEALRAVQKEFNAARFQACTA